MALHEKTNGERAAVPFNGSGGLTKREWFAGLAMQGLISSAEMVPVSESERCALAVVSVAVAEELLKELAR